MVRCVLAWYVTEVGSRIRIDNEAVLRRPTIEPRVFHKNAFPTVLFNDATGMVGAIEYLSYATLFLRRRFAQEFRPAVFAQKPIKVRIISIDLDYDHVTSARFVKHGEEGILIDATCNPESKVFPVLLEFHVAVAFTRIRMDDGEVFRLVIAWRGSGYTFGHGGVDEESERGGVRVSERVGLYRMWGGGAGKIKTRPPWIVT